MQRGIALTLLAGAACAAPASVSLEDAFSGRSGRWVDLSHAYSEETLYWPTAPSFALEQEAYGETPGGWFYSAYRFCTAEHGGTHLDAPIHFARGAHTSDEIPLERLIAPAVVVDVSARSHADYQVGVSDLRAFEAVHGRIPDGSILLLRTGWGERWPDARAYLGTDRRGAGAVAELRFPGLAPEAARWLVRQRRIAAIGIDTASIDFGRSRRFASHVELLGANIPAFENLARLEQLPARGAFVVALPMKIRGGSGGPLRVVAFVPGEVAGR